MAKKIGRYKVLWVYEARYPSDKFTRHNSEQYSIPIIPIDKIIDELKQLILEGKTNELLKRLNQDYIFPDVKKRGQ